MNDVGDGTGDGDNDLDVIFHLTVSSDCYCISTAMIWLQLNQFRQISYYFSEEYLV